MARKTEKGGKFRNVHCRTWKIERKKKNIQQDKQTNEEKKEALKSTVTVRDIKNEETQAQ